jgi:hypothetical protein
MKNWKDGCRVVKKDPDAPSWSLVGG